MSTATATHVTIQAHQTHWYDIVNIILKAAAAANPIIATIIPAPVEAGITIATTLGPVVTGTIQAATDPNAVPAAEPAA